MSEKDLSFELERLNGELFAYRAMLFYFLKRFFMHAPDIVRAALDEAADHAETVTLKFGSDASPQHLAKALEIIEDFRSKIVVPGWGSSSTAQD